jgi:chorismate mutase
MHAMADQMKVVAVRGAVQAEENSAEQIVAATGKLVHELMEMNELAPEDMISAIFTTTPDLDAEFPAVAARGIGLSEVPLMCAREIPVPGAMPRVIRTMVHCNVPADRPVRHVYLGETRSLRADLNAAQ